jgi:hypothetical protein
MVSFAVFLQSYLGCGLILIIGGILLIIMAANVLLQPTSKIIVGLNPPQNNGLVFLIAGVILGLFGIGIFRSAKPSHTVRINSSSGEVNALTSPDKEYIQQIVEAVNKAIVDRG